MSEQHDEQGVEPMAHMELVRLAMLRRVFPYHKLNMP